MINMSIFVVFFQLRFFFLIFHSVPASTDFFPLITQENFVTLMQEIRVEFDTFSPPLMLTSAVAAGDQTIDIAYDVPRLVPLLDKWHIMSYDYHGAWENFTHHHAPLCGHYLDGEEFPTFNVVGGGITHTHTHTHTHNE